jgi:RNase P subunit RPR2
MKKDSKKEIEKKIKEFFEKLVEKTAEDVKKIKKLGMSLNIRLGELRKNFCKKCLTPCIPGITCEVRIKGKLKNVKCRLCKTVNRWKIK